MHVYSVMGGYDWEGADHQSLRLFDCKSAAELYREHLTVVDGYDTAYVSILEVSDWSALCAA